MAAQVSRRALMVGAAFALAGGALAGLTGCGEEPGLKAALLDTGELVFTDSLGKLSDKVKESWPLDESEAYSYTDRAPWHDSARKVTSVRFDVAVKPTSCAWWFSELETCQSIDLTNLDTSACTSMEGMFSYCPKLGSLDLSTLNSGKKSTGYACGGRVVPPGWVWATKKEASTP